LQADRSLRIEEGGCTSLGHKRLSDLTLKAEALLCGGYSQGCAWDAGGAPERGIVPLLPRAES
jgi:hypothetical protein